MKYLEKLNLGLSSKKVPVVLQTEAAECGLACLVAILAYHNFYTDLRTLRQRFNLSLNGATFRDLMRFAHQLNLIPDARKLSHLSQLHHKDIRCPCILHWDAKHFVVMCSVNKQGIVIMDPAIGMRTVKMEEVSQKLTGAILLLDIAANFETRIEKTRIKILPLLKVISGLKRYLLSVFSLAIALEVCAILSPWLMQWVIDNVVVTSDINLLHTLILGFSMLFIYEQFMRLWQSWISMNFSTSLNLQWKSNIFTRLIHLPSNYFIKRHIGDISSRFKSIDQIQSTLTATFFTMLINSIVSIATLYFMFKYSPQLTAVVLGTLTIYIFIRFIFYYYWRNAQNENIIHAAKQDTYFMETIRGIKTVKLFQREVQRHNTWMNLLIHTTNTHLSFQKISIFFDFSNKSLFGAANIIIIYLGAKSILDGSFTVGIFMAFLAYQGQFKDRIGILIENIFELKILSLHQERLADIILTPTEMENVEEIHVPKIEESEQLDIKIENISFRYAVNQPLIIENINLNIKQGESLVFTGHSGCGKSTLMNILMGNLKPESGRVLINGYDIYQYPPSFIRGLSSTVTQDDTLFAGSIADNIAFFDEKIDFNKIRICASIARIHDEIEAMPMKYNTLIGDMGSALSGGQKQRIILARALYQTPRILFLDEATSHLDIENEQAINIMLKELNITKIMVAHRQETINSADRVYNISTKKEYAQTNNVPPYQHSYKSEQSNYPNNETGGGAKMDHNYSIFLDNCDYINSKPPSFWYTTKNKRSKW
ncbi:peptidase domain-containing ABC transporter [Conchiformibius steedae]|uniref:Peptidase domain-containing ABC transporter n=1 Tax=Conchiformibius steedae TaxID=153493 RepID=A0A3P2A621_9NEIS|nr:peptidase domain-containing ABC transporter [Conchiformibius steedae]RRD90912.1 peptidase domain-containing ABC transporter [Conchiformibius steedae]